MPQTRVRPLPRIEPRRKVRRVFDWGAAGWAGLFAGFCALVLETVLMPLAVRGDTPWQAPRLLFEILFDGTLAAPGHGMLAATAFFVHLTLGLIYGRLVAALVFLRPRREAAWIGAAAGAALYFIAFYGIGALVPRIYGLRNWVWLLGHVAFGAVAARAFLRLETVAYE